MKALTVKHVGCGPSGTPAYVVLDGRGNHVPDERGQILLSHAGALAVAGRSGS